MKMTISVVLIAVIGVCVMFFLKGRKSKAKMAAKGVVNGQLAVCGNKPNCVCSFDSRDEFFIEPEKIETNPVGRIKQAFKTMDIEIVSEKDNYIHGTFTSKIFRFIDDIEVLVLQNTIHFRSSSRIGYSDMGANRKRIEELKKLLDEN